MTCFLLRELSDLVHVERDELPLMTRWDAVRALIATVSEVSAIDRLFVNIH